jgi:4-amino-4-deoxy-L-arabinose transferase-like glycosyltransferase
VPSDGAAGGDGPELGPTAAGERQTLSRRATLVGIGLAVLLGLVLRLRFLTVPLITDEAGYAQVARLWSRGEPLYGDYAWVERPQALLAAYRLVAASGWGPMVRVLAMLAASIATVAIGAAAWALAGRRAAVLAAALFAVLSPAPHLEGFTANGELLGMAGTAGAVAFGAWWSVRRDRRLLVLAGVAAACGVLMKQGAADGLVAVAALVLADGWRQRRNPLPDLAVFAGGAALPLLLALLHGVTTVGFDEWWFAMVGHRSTMDSLIRGSYDYHRAKFFESLGPFRRDLGVLVLLAPLGIVAAWKARRLTLPLAWLLASVIGVAAGGVFHPHYWLQVAAPLVLLAALGIDLVATRWAPAAWALGAVAVLVPLAYSFPTYAARTADRVSELTSADHRYVIADEVADAVAAMTEPDDRVAVLWTNAAIHWYADRASPFRHMWFEPLENFSGAAAAARGTITGPDPPAVVVIATRLASLDPDGEVAGALATRYELVDVVEGDHIYRLRPALPAQASVP